MVAKAFTPKKGIKPFAIMKSSLSGRGKELARGALMGREFTSGQCILAKNRILENIVLPMDGQVRRSA